MAQKPPHAAFIDAAHALSHAAPEHWQVFVAAFGDYATHLCISAVQTQGEQAHVARGHAQGALRQHEMLADIEARHRALHTPEKKR